MPESYELNSTDCEGLLRAGAVGRMAVTAPDGPHIIPLNYSVVDDAIVVRTTPYSLLGTHGRNTRVAFEIDQFDHEYHHGWSVQARGLCEAVEHPEDLEHIRSVWSPQPWASGVRTLFLRLRWVELTGRRLGKGWDPFVDLPVRRNL
jgi:nitroimidazol reductase NimA-like FMN-containing flavoprotein (pyridoxamine 5'-phosphate oxidase superfamily)